ncbi:MAK10-like protein [Tanacetum coccineum]
MFQQHHRESLSEAWTRFKDLLQKVPHHGIDRWLQIQLFYDHVFFHLKCEIDRAAGCKLRNKNTDESWEIIENLAFYDHEGLSPQPQALETTFETRMGDYMAARIERMERFENTIFKQREEINGRMIEMFELLKELTTSITPKKVLIREEAKFLVTKNVNFISLAKGEEERSNERKVTPDNIEKPTETGIKMPVKEAEAKDEAENRAENKSIKTPKSEEVVEAPGSQPVAYYLKHEINEKLIKGLVNNNIFNNSLSGTRVGKKKKKAYNVLPGGAIYEAILKKKITKKVRCKRHALLHLYEITDERPAETDIRLSLASHSYIYPLGIAEEVLVEVAEHIYHADFVIMDIKENEKRPFILRMPFLITVKASIKFDTGTITLSLRMGRKDKTSSKKEMEFNQWRSKNFKDECPALTEEEEGVEDVGEVTTIHGIIYTWEELDVIKDPYWSIPQEECHVGHEKTSRSGFLYSGYSQKKHRGHIMDCHVGNLCVHKYDPTNIIRDPIIEGIQGVRFKGAWEALKWLEGSAAGYKRPSLTHTCSSSFPVLEK